MLCQLPFLSLHQTAIYSKLKWFQWQLQIAFENKKQLNQIFWNLIKFRHPLQGYKVIYERVYQRSSLKMTFGKPCWFYKMEECYSSKFFTLEMVAKFMQKIVEVVIALHQQGFNLGVPIERCFLVNIAEMHKSVTILDDKGISKDEALKQSI